jgi:hypothetical protein
MAAEAFPAPTTISLPRGAFGRCGGIQTAGWAEAMAASNICRRNSLADGGRKGIEERTDPIDVDFDGHSILD